MTRTKAKKVYSLLGELFRGNAVMVPLPKEQRDTEERLIARERKIAKFSRKNDSIITRSWLYSEHPELISQSKETNGTAITKKYPTKK